MDIVENEGESVANQVQRVFGGDGVKHRLLRLP